jgi:hypothetical protein
VASGWNRGVGLGRTCTVTEFTEFIKRTNQHVFQILEGEDAERWTRCHVASCWLFLADWNLDVGAVIGEEQLAEDGIMIGGRILERTWTSGYFGGRLTSVGLFFVKLSFEMLRLRSSRFSGIRSWWLCNADASPSDSGTDTKCAMMKDETGRIADLGVFTARVLTGCPPWGSPTSRIVWKPPRLVPPYIVSLPVIVVRRESRQQQQIREYKH